VITFEEKAESYPVEWMMSKSVFLRMERAARRKVLDIKKVMYAKDLGHLSAGTL
jgi:hypothetical protein